MARVFNFNAGPAALPEEVLKEAQGEFLDVAKTGMSILEISHRSKEYEAIHIQAQELLRDLLGITDAYEILFLQGGASLQFAMVPLNLLGQGQVGNYVLTGSWSEKALKEAKLIGETAIAGSSQEANYTYIPQLEDLTFHTNDAYLHITSNNTIFGTQWREFPSHPCLVADMSSDILSKPIDVNRFALIYAGAQKNLGPAGVTVVIIRKDLLKRVPNNIPTMLKYTTHAEANSLYNTPPTMAIYLLGKVLQWVKDQGGVAKIAELNAAKAKLVYDAIDESEGFYKGHAEVASRSLMNVTFTLPTEELTKEFLAEAKIRGFVGLNGHRSVGGCRASIYNAVPYETCAALADFMVQFQKQKRGQYAETSAQE